ncbi:SCP2 sterol-binding domain-containing protein [Jatrophihabitans sp. YIM 134969]
MSPTDIPARPRPDVAGPTLGGDAPVATKQECEAAFARLADMLGQVDEKTRKKVVLDRTIAATITDLDTVFQGRLRDGGLHDIHEVAQADAQIKLAMASDTLVALTDGSLGFASAWASGKLKVDASVFDLLKLRALF